MEEQPLGRTRDPAPRVGTTASGTRCAPKHAEGGEAEPQS